LLSYRGYIVLKTIFRSSPSGVLIDLGLLLEVVSIHPSVRPQRFSDFALIRCIGRPRLDMRTSVTSTQSKVKGEGHGVPEVPKIALF